MLLEEATVTHKPLITSICINVHEEGVYHRKQMESSDYYDSHKLCTLKYLSLGTV